jgi:probable F420-dependent oxidoreductase
VGVTRPLQVGIQLPEVEWEISFPELIEMAQAAEEVGFDSIWVGDHLLYDLPVGSRGPWEAWTSLAALAAVTSRVQLGPLVASIGFREPTLLAKEAATIDAISGGRFVLGLGAGWNEREYRAFGFAYDHRVSRFEEALSVIRALLRTGRCDFHGAYYDVDDCVLHPRGPRPAGPPLMLGSTSPRMLSIGLPHVDQWNVWWSIYGNTAAGFASEKARVDAALVATGREPSAVEATCAVHIRLPGGGGRQMGDSTGAGTPPIEGSPAEIADHLREFAAAGASHVQLVVDPIRLESVTFFADVLADLDG